MLLEGKTALVTGAGGGIGRAIAVAMAQAGAAVVINDVGVSLSGEGGSASPAEETRAAIEAEGGRAVVDTHSVSEWDSAKAIVGTAIAAFGRLDIVVNNAGILRDAIFHKMTPEQWLAVVGVHLNGSFFVSRAGGGGLQGAAGRCFRAHDQHVGPHRQRRAGELRRREDGGRRPIEIDRA